MNRLPCKNNKNRIHGIGIPTMQFRFFSYTVSPSIKTIPKTTEPPKIQDRTYAKIYLSINNSN